VIVRAETRVKTAAALFAAMSFGCAPSPKRAPPPPPPPAPVPAPTPVRAPSEAPEPTPLPPKAPSVRIEPPPAPLPEEPGSPARFEARELRTAEGQRLRYRLYRPANVDPDKKYPLMVFLHGASGRGSDNRKQINGSRLWGSELWTSDEVQQRYPSFVLVPQADPAYAPTWVRKWRVPDKPNPARREPLELVRLLIDELTEELPLDRERLYASGYSMGGFGVWIAVSRYPRLFAAAVPISGGGDPSDVGDAETAIWAFHGGADRSVPPRRSRQMVEALRKAGKEPRYTEYAGAGHEIQRRVYAEAAIVDWVFAQRLPRR
jgi:predicted peptidase